MAGAKRALVRGRPAFYWRVLEGHLVLRDTQSHAETDVPSRHLTDPEFVRCHVDRLRAKRWVCPAAIEEFLAIVDGARP